MTGQVLKIENFTYIYYYGGVGNNFEFFDEVIVYNVDDDIWLTNLTYGFTSTNVNKTLPRARASPIFLPLSTFNNSFLMASGGAYNGANYQNITARPDSRILTVENITKNFYTGKAGTTTGNSQRPEEVDIISSKEGSPTGTIVGAVVGCVFGVLIAGVALFWLYSKYYRKSNYQDVEMTAVWKSDVFIKILKIFRGTKQLMKYLLWRDLVEVILVM